MESRTDQGSSDHVPDSWEDIDVGGNNPAMEVSEAANATSGEAKGEASSQAEGEPVRVAPSKGPNDSKGETEPEVGESKRPDEGEAPNPELEKIENLVQSLISRQKQAQSGQKGGHRVSGNVNNNYQTDRNLRKHKPSSKPLTTTWGGQDIRYKQNVSKKGSATNGDIAGSNPKAGGSRGGGSMPQGSDNVRKDKSKVAVPGKLSKAAGTKAGKEVVVFTTKAKQGRKSHEGGKKSAKEDKGEGKAKPVNDGELSKLLKKVDLKGSDVIVESQVNVGGEGEPTEVAGSKGDGTGEPAKEASVEKAKGGVVGEPEEAANDVEGGKSKGKKVWRTFDNEKDRLAYIADRKERSKVKRKKLMERKRQREDASVPPKAACAAAKPRSRSPSKTKGNSSAPKAAPKPEYSGAPSTRKQAGGRSKSTSKPEPKGAPSLGKRAGGLSPYAPVPKRLKGQVTNKSEVDEQISTWLANADDAEMAESFMSRADLLTRHGPRTLAQLASMSERMQSGEGRNEVNWVDTSYHPSSVNFLVERRLRYFQLDSSSQGRIESLDREADAPLMAAMMEPGSNVFHSSLIVDLHWTLQRSIDNGETFNCHQCSMNHPLTRAPTTVLLTENEQVATFRSPSNCTKTDEVRPKLPKAGPGTHCDVLFIPCGLKGAVMPVFEAVYGQHRGPLHVVVDLGEGCIRDGESVESVKRQLLKLAREIMAVRPKNERENTRVLIPLSFASKDGRKVVLNSWDHSVFDVSAQLRLHHLNLLKRNFNTRLGHVPNEEAAVLLDTTFFKEIVTKGTDAGGRMFEKVNYLDQSTALLDSQGRLHPTKVGLFSRIQDILLYVNSPAVGAKWGHEHFI